MTTLLENYLCKKSSQSLEISKLEYFGAEEY